MTDKYDVVVFGATGFTGERVIRYAARAHDVRRIAAAGRSRSKLEAVAQSFPGLGIVSDIDVREPEALARMVNCAKVLLNCVGPYRHYGEPVVKACVEHSVDYVDVSGEPEFMERMHLKYDDAARAAGCFIIAACGFDSVPAEIGATLCVQALQAQGLVPNRVDSYLSISAGPAGMRGHYATYESAVYGVSSVGALGKVRAEAKAKGLHRPPSIPGPRPQRMKAFSWNRELGKWVMPFPGSDASVVRRTMAARAAAGAAAAHYVAAFTLTKTWSLARYMAFGGLCTTLASFPWGVALLLRHPELFSSGMFTHDGPTEVQMRGTSFSMLHRGYGLKDPASLPDSKPNVSILVAGPEPGYVATPVIMVEGALELMTAREEISRKIGPGGVMTPGYALLMHGNSYIDRLKAAGLTIGPAA